MKTLWKFCTYLALLHALSVSSAFADIKEGMTEFDNQFYHFHAEFMRGADVALEVSSLNGHPAPAGSINLFGQSTWDLCAPPEQANSIYQLSQDQIALAAPELLARVNTILFSEMNLANLCQSVPSSVSSPIFPFWLYPRRACSGNAQALPQGTPQATPTPAVPLMTNYTPEELAALQLRLQNWWAIYTDSNHPCHVTWAPPSGTTPGKWKCETAQRCLNSKGNSILSCQVGPTPLSSACTCAWQGASQALGVSAPVGDVPCVCGGGGCAAWAIATINVTTAVGNQGLPPSSGGGTRLVLIRGNCVTTGTPVIVDNCFCPG